MNRRKNPLIIAAALALAIALGTTAQPSEAGERVPLAKVSHIHGIAVDPADPQRLYLATHYGVWLTSADGTAERISDNDNDYMGFSPHPSEAVTFLASGHPSTGGNMGVIVSKDGARTWQLLADGIEGPVDFHAMDVSAADPNVVYGLYGSVQVSRDGGKSWTVAGSPPTDVFDLAASAVNPDIVYAATRNGLMASFDGGKTWKAAGTEGQPASMVETAPDGTVYAFVLGSGLMKAPAAALAWQPIANTFGEQILLHMAFDPANPKRMFAVTEKSKILTSTDGGKSWAAMSS
ncbi:exo-alpha-sialidase (plasmid) [Sinorhizobium meliloti]|uniref:F510_1955 family glycosylhydrolase n=1 Tax=Rhizobium meliloti TaxID=382 RepID=UPI00299E071F|nr:exo-alpha-sialidase [Sinorhizobium meliloti]MDW9998151.1 exo-alpha-sialidase [Sinorhizobium meliloti]